MLIAVLARLVPVRILSQLFAGVAFTPGEVIGLVASSIALGVVALTVARRVLRSIVAP